MSSTTVSVCMDLLYTLFFRPSPREGRGLVREASLPPRGSTLDRDRDREGQIFIRRPLCASGGRWIASPRRQVKSDWIPQKNAVFCEDRAAPGASICPSSPPPVHPPRATRRPAPPQAPGPSEVAAPVSPPMAHEA